MLLMHFLTSQPIRIALIESRCALNMHACKDANMRQETERWMWVGKAMSLSEKTDAQKWLGPKSFLAPLWGCLNSAEVISDCSALQKEASRQFWKHHLHDASQPQVAAPSILEVPWQCYFGSAEKFQLPSSLRSRRRKALNASGAWPIVSLAFGSVNASVSFSTQGL